MSKIYVSHISDCHSAFTKINNKAKIIFNSGDWMPNITRGKIDVEKRYQKEWILLNIEKIKSWLNGKTMYYCAGNHDFFKDFNDVFVNNNINLVDITNKFCVDPLTNLSMYGFPYIPYIDGEWNYELRGQEMLNEFKKMLNVLKDNNCDKLDILLAHCPPYGILDKNIQCDHIGNQILSDYISYGDFNPGYILCGHCHENKGIVKINKTLISNAATTQHLIKIDMAGLDSAPP